MSIKPIETIYNGYRFRSRLEARWAVFFDAAGIKYEYEPEGFDLDGEYYLPDFYLPQFSLFVEIKPFNKDVVHYVGDRNEWEKKCCKFRDITEQPILLCYSDPYASLFCRLFAYDCIDSSVGICDLDCMFAEFNNKIVLVTYSEREDCSICINPCMIHSNRIGTSYEFTGNDSLWEKAFFPENWENNGLAMARIKARQARFEHGECG